MKLKQIADNLKKEGAKYRWNKGSLISYGFLPEPSYCVLGIKCKEAGIPDLVLAWFDAGHGYVGMPYVVMQIYRKLEPVMNLNDNAADKIALIEKLSSANDETDYPVEEFIESLKSKELLQKAIAWATEPRHGSLLKGLS